MANVEDDDTSSPPATQKNKSPKNGILSKFPFMRSPTSPSEPPPTQPGDLNTRLPRNMADPPQPQQQKSRPRRGSLRKAALLGRGVQRDERTAKTLTIDTSHSVEAVGSLRSDGRGRPSDVTPWPELEDSVFLSSMGSDVNNTTVPSTTLGSALAPPGQQMSGHAPSPTLSASTTDDEDSLHMPSSMPPPSRNGLSMSSGSDSYDSNAASGSRRRTVQRAKSPLSFATMGLSSTPLPSTDSEWDYAETEWWGWVILVLTWFVFVTGMGSAFGVWSWAWDVGTTPYAPPEFEDDPTLPIVGYYPSLIILSAVMAWCWVIVAWVGMKYFRHAKISGD